MIPRYHPQIGLADALRRGRGNEGFSTELWAQGRNLREGENLFFLNGATAALATAIRALGLPGGSGVGVSAYACVTVFEAIAAAGMKCVFVDVDATTLGPDLASLRQREPEMHALVLIHLFGLPADVPAVQAILGGKPIIEDCSHAMGSGEGNGPVGFGGAAGAFSFNFHKPVSAGGGGLLVVRDDLSARAKELIAAMPVAPDGLKRRAAKAVMSLCFRPWVYGLLARSGKLDLRRDGALSGEVVLERMSPGDRAVAAERIRRAATRFERQRDWARQLGELTGPIHPACACLQRGDQWNGYLWPMLLASHERREESLDFFHARGVDAFVLWPESLRTAARFGYTTGQCPTLENALPRLLLLPCYAELTARQRAR
ncbi:MAG: DegT/DnrJ/EryC1/StrS family aminotransferase, partial [Planctomycetota bacterium]|nr:DegT/DnrJ/EryC1/StrS family aminotransferase [Planctomycetota bacterium]